MERQFGPYRLIRQIAVGGMAEIHLAKTRGIAGFEKYVALKMIHPNFAEDEQFIQMLIDEAKIAVQLQHVNVAQTFDLGRVGDNYYITMEFVDGADLYKILRRGSEQDIDVPLDVCAYTAKEIATGLDYAHRKKDMAGNPLGIVHRDISPQNVLVSHAGEVKLVDFGIAKATMKVRQTAAGVIKGKYYYMSPEQAWGDPLDHRSDIFSAGIVLYEMITSQMLYLEEDLQKLLERVRKADIAPPSRLRKDVPPQLERIVMHALAKVPGERYQSAADLANDLERFLHTYSPVFTASRVARHLRAVLGDPVEARKQAEAEALEPRDPLLNTMPLDERELLHDRSELRDENSVIFRLDGLKRPAVPQPSPADDDASTAAELPRGTRPLAQPPSPPPAPRAPAPSRAAPVKIEIPRITQRPGGKTEPPPQAVPRARPRDPHEETRPVNASMLQASTWSMDPEELDVGDRTIVSAPPGFDTQQRADSDTGTRDLGTADLAFEPTQMSSADDGWDDNAETTVGDDSNDLVAAARMARDRMAAQQRQLDHDDDLEDEDGPTMSRMDPVGGRPPPSPPLRDRASPPAALAARNPTPAVSELRRPQRSRRTPPGGGVPVPPTGSVLQSIVGAAGSEPMPAPGRGVPSDGVPARMPGEGSTGAQTAPANPHAMGGQAIPQPQDSQSYPPQFYPPPMQPGVPPHLQPYAQWPQPAQMIAPGVPYQQGMATPPGVGVPHYPFQPYNPGGPTFTSQMRAAMEIDEIGPQYKIEKSGPRWFVLVIASLLAIAGSAVATVLILRATREDDTPLAASIRITSTPSGATVFVDDEQLAQPTPTTFTTTAPGKKHKVRIVLAKHKQFVDDNVVMPNAGGEVGVSAALKVLTGTIKINSSPDAEIYIKNEPRGMTPKILTDVEIDTTTELELRHRIYGSRRVPLTYNADGVAEVDEDLKPK